MNYEAIIIGTGFGGTIAATRLLELRKQGKLGKPGAEGRILMLERGTWWYTPEKLGLPPRGARDFPGWAEQNRQPVQYWPRPNHAGGVHSFLATTRGPLNKNGLYQYTTFEDVHVVTAAGVGGGSLIYSGVNLRAPQAVRDHIGLKLTDGQYDGAADWMEKNRGALSYIVTKIPVPRTDKQQPRTEQWEESLSDSDEEQYLYLDRSRELKRVAKALGKEWKPLPLSTTEYSPAAGSQSRQGHTFCERQGRCALGCLPGARHTLSKKIFNDLLFGGNTGVELWPKATVIRVEKRADPDYPYVVTFYDGWVENRHVQRFAKNVIFAGGTLGTTELLLRSRFDPVGRPSGLPLSERLGHGFSTNGDFGAFVTRTRSAVYSSRGPINTCHFRTVEDGLHITVEDCAIPEMFAQVAASALHAIEATSAADFLHAMRELYDSLVTGHVIDWTSFWPRLLPNLKDAKSFMTEAEIVANTAFYNLMGQDRANGVFSITDDDRLTLRYPDGARLRDDPVYARIEDLMRQVAREMSTEAEHGYRPLPVWRGLGPLGPSGKIVTTHPIGGCPIGETREKGAVDEFGRLFTSEGVDPTAVHPGLYVLDGSTLPGALSVNPTLTIAAQVIKALDKSFPL